MKNNSLKKRYSIKKYLLLITLLILNWIFYLSFWNYIYNKTIWYDKTDCMIQYVNNYYPYWSVYEVDWSPHIDKRWMSYLKEEKEINGCFINNSIPSFIYNSTYCYITLIYEDFLKNLK